MHMSGALMGLTPLRTLSTMYLTHTHTTHKGEGGHIYPRGGDLVREYENMDMWRVESADFGALGLG